MQNKNEFNQPIGEEVKNWCAKALPKKISLSGTFCIIEPFDIDKHSTPLFANLALNNQGESWTYLPYGPFANCHDFQTWLSKTMAEPDTLLYAILDVKSRLPIGIAGFLRINPEHGVVEIGHLHYSTLLQKTPAATEAMYLLMHYVFEQLQYRRYEWKCNALNQASRTAALRLGFQFEGIFRQSNVFKNLNRDTAWFSIIDSEWPGLKTKFMRWLSADNFDSSGKQIMKLNPETT